MLTELFIASTSGIHQSPSSVAIKDASIFIHEFQPLPAIRTSFKKSATAPHCLAASASHIFAAQAEKAVVHVYNRDKGNQEALVPFPERIHSLALAADGTILILGTEGGRIFLWETCTGRQVATQAAHLQAVTTLAVDIDSNFLLSGSPDSNIHVWSLPDILSWSNTDSTSQDRLKSLRHTLSDHRAAITSLVLGHSASFLNIAISASEDSSCIIWNYQSKQALRTILLPSTPLCLALDPADRCFYTGFDDGSVQLLRFYNDSGAPAINIHDPHQAQNATKPQEKDRWAAVGQDLGTTLSMDLSYDGTKLLTGHEKGKVICWDIGAGSFQSTLCDLHGGVTNIRFETPAGFVGGVEEPRFKIHSVTKPRFDLSTTAKGTVPSAYTFTTQFITDLPDRSDSKLYESGTLSSRERFDQALFHPSFPNSLLESGMAELAALRDQPVSKSNSASAPLNANSTYDHDADFVSLNEEAGASALTNGDGADGATAELEQENQALKDQLAALKRVMNKSLDQLEELRKERKAWVRFEGEEAEMAGEEGDLYADVVMDAYGSPDDSEGENENDQDAQNNDRG
ncbi:MAG: hypothetical protein Q9157_008403 [Trypethelium eluteriae]